jgi:hypothetical protein
MNPVFVEGVGFWSPGFGDAAAWCGGEQDPAIERPEAACLEGPLRRRASELTRMAIDSLAQAAAQAGHDPAQVPTVWATAHGEHTTALKLLAMMHRGEGKLSPTHFHNSVHNTAGGYASIATGNTSVSTTLTGGAELVAAGLLEAICLVEKTEGPVVLVLADEPLKEPFARADSKAPVALSLCLSSRPEGAIARLSSLRREAVEPLQPEEHFGSLHVAAGVPLLERVTRGQAGSVALEFASKGGGPVWCVDVDRTQE